MNKYNFKSKMINIQQYYTIPLPYSVYSRWTQEHSFQVFLILKNSPDLVIRYEHSSRLTTRHFKIGDF